jgi:hypothetical protein
MIKEEELTKKTLIRLKNKHNDIYSFEKNRVTSLVGKKGKPDVTCLGKDKLYLDFNIEFKNIKKNIKEEYNKNKTSRYLFQLAYARQIITPTIFFNYFDNTYFITNSTLFKECRESELFYVSDIAIDFIKIINNIIFIVDKK